MRSTSPASRPKSGYLPSLDGWRAIAILGVMMTHDEPWSFAGHSNAPWKNLGSMGVTLFFAISGYLICTRILQEEASLGVFRLKAFYVRRLFRIQPAAICYLAVIAILMCFGIVHEALHHWLGALFLYNNYLFRPNDPSLTFTGHFWTLSVEEHFYLLLSLLLFAFRRNRIAIFASLLLLLKVAQHFAQTHGYHTDASARETFWVIQFLLTPALAALLLKKPEVRQFVIRYIRPWVAFCITFALIAFDVLLSHGALVKKPWWIIVELESTRIFYSFTLWIIATSLHPHSWTTRILELPALRWLGRLSYSLYLWHVLFFAPSVPQVGITNATLLFLGDRPWKYIAALLMAILSYYFVEKPLIRFGHRVAPPVTPGHRDFSVPPPATS